MNICFDLDLYSEEAVSKAIKDYQDIAVITTRKEGEQMECVFRSCADQFPEQLVIHEFSNYVLNLTVSGKE